LSVIGIMCMLDIGLEYNKDLQVGVLTLSTEVVDGYQSWG
jgi:hypothetical protein